MRVRISTSLVAVLLLAACARGEDAGPLENVSVADKQAEQAVIDDLDTAANATSGTLPTDAWVGKWVGIEGTVLDIQPAGEAGHYVLSVTLLDGTNSYDGTAEGDMIRFARNNRSESVRAATGAATGLKWLADKQNCLMIQQGEGFCRDDVKPPADAQPVKSPA